MKKVIILLLAVLLILGSGMCGDALGNAMAEGPVSERSKAFDPNINFNIYLRREDSHLFGW